MPPPQAPSSFNPLKVLIPSAVALVVVFVAIWAFTRNSPASGSNTNQQTETLAADPNSQPVQPAQSPTGKSEQGIPSGGTITPPANVNASPDASPEASIGSARGPESCSNANENSEQNE